MKVALCDVVAAERNLDASPPILLSKSPAASHSRAVDFLQHGQFSSQNLLAKLILQGVR